MRYPGLYLQDTVVHRQAQFFQQALTTLVTDTGFYCILLHYCIFDVHLTTFFKIIFNVISDFNMYFSSVFNPEDTISFLCTCL